MKKQEIIKKSTEFTKIIKQGKYNKNDYFIIYRFPKEEQIPLFGITISKKSGNAVIRNKLKRQTKNIIDELKDQFLDNYDYIIMIRIKSVDKDYQLLKQKLSSLINFKEKK